MLPNTLRINVSYKIHALCEVGVDRGTANMCFDVPNLAGFADLPMLRILLAVSALKQVERRWRR